MPQGVAVPGQIDRNGLAFSGVASSRVNAAVSSQTVGSGPLSLVVRFRCPDSPPVGSATPGLVVLGGSSTGAGSNALGMRLLSSGALQVVQRDGSGGTAATASFANFAQTFAGQVVEVVFAKNGATVTGFVNGASYPITVTAGTGSFNQSVTSTDFNLGIFDASDVLTGIIYNAGFFNRTLPASDALRLYQRGVDMSDEWGSMATATSNSPTFLVMGARYRIETFVAGDSFAGTVTSGTANTTGCEFISDGTATWSNGSTLRRIGAIVWLPLDQNIGRQAHNMGPVRADGSIRGSGINWVYPVPRAGVLRWQSSVNAGQNIIGDNEALPLDAIVTSVTVENATLGTGQTVSLGFATAGTPTDVINAGALGGNGSFTTFFPTTGAPAAGNLRVSFSTSGTIRLAINYTRL